MVFANSASVGIRSTRHYPSVPKQTTIHCMGSANSSIQHEILFALIVHGKCVFIKVALRIWKSNVLVRLLVFVSEFAQ